MQSWLEGRIWVGKGAQATGMTASLRIQSSKADSTLVRASQGVNWSWSQCIKSHHAQTSSGKGLPSHFWTRDNVRSILPGLWRKRTGLLLSGPKSFFQMKVNFAFHLEIKFPESGGRVERHRIHVAWSSTVSDDLGCHVICWCWSTVFFWSPQSTQHLPGDFRALSCFLLLTSFMEMLISFSSRTWHLPTLPKVRKAGSMTMVLQCLIGQQTRLTWTP